MAWTQWGHCYLESNSAGYPTSSGGGYPSDSSLPFPPKSPLNSSYERSFKGFSSGSNGIHVVAYYFTSSTMSLLMGWYAEAIATTIPTTTIFNIEDLLKYLYNYYVLKISIF